MPRSAKPTGKTRHDPLHVQLKEDELFEKYGNVSHPGKRKKSKKDDDEALPGDVSTCMLNHTHTCPNCSEGCIRPQDV